MKSTLSTLTLLATAYAGELHFIHYNDPRPDYAKIAIGYLDPGTGEFESAPVTIPVVDPCPNGTFTNWTLAAGETTSSFYVNGSLFFVAQQRCCSKDTSPCDNETVVHTSLFSTWGIGPPVEVTVRQLASLDTLVPPGDDTADVLDRMHVQWDFTCNLIVTVPVPSGPDSRGTMFNVT